MNAKIWNRSQRSLFLTGGRLDMLLQIEEADDEQRAVRFGQGLEVLAECPCGCRLKNDVCSERSAVVKRLNEEIPF